MHRTVLALILPFVALAQPAREASRQAAIDFARQGRFEDALHALSRQTQADPADAGAWMMLGELQYRLGYYEAALTPLSHAIELRPASTGPRILRAVCLFKTAHPAEAAELAKTLLAAQPPPNDIDLSLTYAEYLYERQEVDEALRQTRAAVEFAPQHPIGHFWLARLLLEKRQVDEAAQAAEKSVALAPDLPYARNLLVRIYRQLGRAEDAARQAAWLREYENRKAVK